MIFWFWWGNGRITPIIPSDPETLSLCVAGWKTQFSVGVAVYQTNSVSIAVSQTKQVISTAEWGQ